MKQSGDHLVASLEGLLLKEKNRINKGFGEINWKEQFKLHFLLLRIILVLDSTQSNPIVTVIIITTIPTISLTDRTSTALTK